MRKLLVAVVAACSLGVACTPPPTPEGFEGESEACQIMVAVMKVHGEDGYQLTRWLHIGKRESNCFLWAHARDRDDDSYCWFQINYIGNLRVGRTRLYGPPENLLVDPDACAVAAIDLRNRAGWSPWAIN